jgi:hypothetical protein
MTSSKVKYLMLREKGRSILLFYQRSENQQHADTRTHQDKIQFNN